MKGPLVKTLFWGIIATAILAACTTRPEVNSNLRYELDAHGTNPEDVGRSNDSHGPVQ